MKLKTKILLSLFAFSPMWMFAGGPWASGHQHGYGQLSFTYIKYSELLSTTLEDNPILRRPVRDYTLQGYIEYGLTDKITLIGTLPFKLSGTDDEINATTWQPDTLAAGDLNGMSNISLAGKYTFLNKKIVMAAQAKIEARTFRVDQMTGLRTGYENWAFVPSIFLGTSFSEGKGYAFTEVGAAVRTHEYSEELRAMVEVGYQPLKNFWTAAVIDVRQSFENGSFDDGNVLHTSLMVNDQSYGSWGVKLAYQSENYGVNLGFYGAFYGDLVAAFPAISLGVSRKW